MNPKVILVHVCALTMSAPAFADGDRKDHVVVRTAAAIQTSQWQSVSGRVQVASVDQGATESSRPNSARRAALLATAKGQALASRARQDLAKSLEAHKFGMVAALRLRAGMSQRELCAEMGILQPHLSRLENGRVAAPELQTLVSMASALRAPIGELIDAFISDSSRVV